MNKYRCASNSNPIEINAVSKNEIFGKRQNKRHFDFISFDFCIENFNSIVVIQMNE